MNTEEEIAQMTRAEALDRVAENNVVVRDDLLALGRAYGLDKLDDLESVFGDAHTLETGDYLSRIDEFDIYNWERVLRKDGTILFIPFQKKIFQAEGDTACDNTTPFRKSYGRDPTLEFRTTYIADRVHECCSDDKVPLIALIQRSGSGKTHSALQLAQLKKYKQTSVVVVQLGKQGGDTEFLKELIKMDDKKLELFAENCINLARSSQRRDPFKIQEDALKATKENETVTISPGGNIKTIIIYLDEITSLTADHRTVFYNLRAGFIRNLKDIKVRKAIVLTDTNAAISDLMPHKSRDSGKTSTEPLDGFVQRVCMLPPAVFGLPKLKNAILENAAARGILVRPQEAKALATLLHGPPLWITTFFSGMQDRNWTVKGGLWDVFNRIFGNKIGKGLMTDNMEDLCQILVRVLLSNCMGNPNAMNEQHLTKSGPFEVRASAKPEMCNKIPDVISPREMKRALALAPVGEPLTTAACMTLIADKMEDTSFIKTLYEEFRGILSTRYSRTDEDTKGSLFEYEFSFHLLLGYIHRNKDYFSSLKNGGTWNKIRCVEELFPEASFSECLESLKIVCERLGISVELCSYGKRDSLVRASGIEAWPRFLKYSIGIMPRGNTGYDMRVGSVIIEAKDDKNALSRDLKAKFKGHGDKTKCFVFRGPFRKVKLGEPMWMELSDGHNYVKKFIDKSNKGKDTSRVPDFIVRYWTDTQKNEDMTELLRTLSENSHDDFERMSLNEMSMNFGIHESHYYDVDFLPAWKNRALGILAPELRDVLPQLPEEGQAVQRDAAVVRSGQVFALSKVGSTESTNGLTLVKKIEELKNPVGVYIPGSIIPSRAEKFLNWILEHNCDPASLTVFGKDWEISEENLFEVFVGALGRR